MGGQTTETTQKENSNSQSTTNPWGPSIPYLTNIFNTANKMWQYGVGPQVYPGSTVAPFSQPTQTALNKGFQMASAGSELPGMATDWAKKMFETGANGQANFVNPFAGDVKQWLTPMASGSEVGGNPYFQNALDFQANKVKSQIDSMYSGLGRGLSGDHSRRLADELSGLRFGALANQYNADKGFQTQANQILAGVGDNNASFMGNLLGQLPTLDALRYNDVDRMSKIGSVLEDKTGQLLSENKAKFDLQNMLPWQHLQLFNSMIQPGVGGTQYGNTQGTSTGTTSTPFNPTSLLGIPMMMGGK